MTSEDKISQLLATLVRLTVKGELAWHVANPKELTRGSDDIVKYFCVTNYKDQDLAVFEQRSRLFDGDREQFYWTSAPVFAMLDRSGDVVWEHTGNWAEVETLLKVARESAGHVNQMLERLLA